MHVFSHISIAHLKPISACICSDKLPHNLGMRFVSQSTLMEDCHSSISANATNVIEGLSFPLFKREYATPSTRL